MRLVDLSQPWSVRTQPYPGHPLPKITVFQNLCKDRLESYIIETSCHVGTHIDAPLHSASGTWDVAQIPLERLYGPTVVVDLSRVVDDWTLITPELIERHNPVGLNPGDALIVYVDWQKYSYVGSQPDPEKYFGRQPGPHPSLADWLIAKGVRWVGSDAASFEHPMNVFAQQSRPDLVAEFERKLGVKASEIFPPEAWMCTHIKLAKRNIPHVDNVGEAVARFAGQRITTGVFPWRFVGGEAAFARLVAFLP